jgi:hypothetical protein
MDKVTSVLRILPKDLKRVTASNNRGAINIFLIPFILVSLFFIAASGVAYWAYQERQDYKDHSDKKVAAAVEVAKQEEATAKDKAFVEKEKQPFVIYDGPSQYGSVKVTYPKTWSVYVDSTGEGEPPVEVYFHPKVVPSTKSQHNAFALRVDVVSRSYADVMKSLGGYVTQNQAKVTPYAFPKVQNIVGSRVEGKISATKTGSMIVVPMRDKTLKVWTEADQFKGDFDNIILANFSFSP